MSLDSAEARRLSMLAELFEARRRSPIEGVLAVVASERKQAAARSAEPVRR